MRVEFENLEEVIESLKDTVKTDRLRQGLEKACIIVENDAKMRCPVKNAQLRNSITHEVEGDTAYVGTNVEYAPYVECGTGIFAEKGNGRQDRWCYQDAEGKWWSTIGQKPQPFLRPAIENNRKQIAQIVKEAITE